MSLVEDTKARMTGKELPVKGRADDAAALLRTHLLAEMGEGARELTITTANDYVFPKDRYFGPCGGAYVFEVKRPGASKRHAVLAEIGWDLFSGPHFGRLFLVEETMTRGFLGLTRVTHRETVLNTLEAAERIAR